VVTRLIPGMAELMRLRSMEKTRWQPCRGRWWAIRAQSLIINLPAARKGGGNLEAVWQVIGHAWKRSVRQQRLR